MLERRREQSPVANLSELEGLTGLNSKAGGAVLAAQAGATFRLVVSFDTDRGGQRAIESQLAFAGPEADRPFYWREGWRERAGVRDDKQRDDTRDILPENAAARAPYAGRTG